MNALGRIVVVIPTYNERENLPLIVGRVRAATPEADILVVDDNSPDGTGDLADEIAATDAQVRVVHRRTKDGLGAAYVAGFKQALDQGYDVMVEMDADGSHQPEQLPLVLAGLADADLVIGSRWVPGGVVENWPKRREALSRCANAYARLMIGMPIHDATGGFRAFRRSTLEKISLDTVDSRGYCFQIDLALRTHKAGLRVTEVPITFVDRVHGTSKMSQAVVAESMLKVTQWGLTARLTRRR
ncbi:MAG: polyprenol monophosphomannose synthase [Streptosporangiaceae bacterium]